MTALMAMKHTSAGRPYERALSPSTVRQTVHAAAAAATHAQTMNRQ